MSNYKVALKEHLCKRSYGCGVYTVCMCSLAKDMADRIEQLEAIMRQAHDHMHNLCAIIPHNDGAYEYNVSLMASIRAALEEKDDSAA